MLNIGHRITIPELTEKVSVPRCSQGYTDISIGRIMKDSCHEFYSVPPGGYTSSSLVPRIDFKYTNDLTTPISANGFEI